MQADAYTCSGARTVDALMRWPGGAAMLVEDGPDHRMTNTATGGCSQLDGATTLRNSALRRAGLHAVSVLVKNRSDHELQSRVFR